MLKKILQSIFPSKRCSCEEGERTLTNIEVGQSVTIKCLRADAGVCQRLREMGFCESAVVKKIADNGALICKVCDAKVVISKKLASNIIVKDLCSKDSASENNKTVLLSEMSTGQQGVILDFVGESDDCERIEEMGITPGERVEIIRYAPLGDPIEIRIRGYLLSLRKEEADLIEVTLS
jgi:ferrous iron transport protein A